MTDQSGTCTSLYPSSTASDTGGPPSPRSITADQDENNDVPVVDESHDYDGDDVSYRLRLLVKNSYFLPPAHSKPRPSELVPQNQITSKKSNPTGLFDFFRGKSKSKPTTPVGNQNFEAMVPALRTASDATTTSAYALAHHDRSASAPHSPLPPPARVVVVREKLLDLVTAAKQAEQEMKLRAVRRDQGSQQAVPIFDDVIDPTDAVDLPPPSSDYLFTVQASALSGLGVQESLGAAVLADCLPPQSPGASNAEEEWRRALLKAAVGHSLDNLHELSISSPTSSNQLISPLSIDQKIISNPIIESSSEKTASLKLSSKRTPVSRNSSNIPRRVDTPSAPLIPLNPPPRKVINPLYSLSQTDLPAAAPEVPPPLPLLPVLSGGSEPLRQAISITPPPVLSNSSPRTSQDGRSSSVARATSFESYYDDGATSTIGRPSISSEYSQPSPTASAFQDSLHIGRTSFVHQRQTRPSTDSRPSTSQRHHNLSPPPRVSSSFAPLPLSPPPRTSSRGQDSSETAFMRKRKERLEILAPEPTEPPVPETPEPLTVKIPTGRIRTSSIRSAPAPSEPPSFFDTIQSQPNALDDLDSSSDESEDAESEVHAEPLFVMPTTRPQSTPKRPFMRLGNHSSPHIQRQTETLPFGAIDGKQPVGHLSKPAPFFSKKISGRSEDGHGPPVSTFDFYQYTKHPNTRLIDAGKKRAITPKRPVTAGDEEAQRRAKESLQKLDNMLLQHMKEEKTRIRQIATTVASSSQSHER